MIVSISEEIDQNVYQELVDELIEYNASYRGKFEEEVNLPFEIVVKNDEGIIGGLFGRSHWGTLEIKTFIIKEKFRNADIGTQLLKSAENEATKRNCNYISLDTYSFQAPDFYTKNGYSIIGIEENPEKGFSKYYLRKKIV